MAIIIPADVKLPLRDVAPKNGRDFQLTQLYELLSCDMIEIRRLADGRIMVLDEEGKLTDKPRNERATLLADFATPKQLIAEMSRMREAGVSVAWVGEPITSMATEVDYIVGDVLICNSGEVR